MNVYLKRLLHKNTSLLNGNYRLEKTIGKQHPVLQLCRSIKGSNPEDKIVKQ